MRLVEAPTRPAARASDAPAYMQGFRAALSAWVTEHGVAPGCAEAVTSSDLYRHFAQWAEERAPGLPALTNHTWGCEMRGLGLPRGRRWIDGRECRPYLLPSSPAAYFKAWVKENPPPPVGQDPFSISRRPRADKGTR